MMKNAHLSYFHFPAVFKTIGPFLKASFAHLFVIGSRQQGSLYEFKRRRLTGQGTAERFLFVAKGLVCVRTSDARSCRSVSSGCTCVFYSSIMKKKRRRVLDRELEYIILFELISYLTCCNVFIEMSLSLEWYRPGYLQCYLTHIVKRIKRRWVYDTYTDVPTTP